MKDALLRLAKQEAQNKCGVLGVFKRDQSGFKRCIKQVTVILNVNVSAVTVLSAKKLVPNKIYLLGDRNHNFKYQPTSLNINNNSSLFMIQILTFSPSNINNT